MMVHAYAGKTHSVCAHLAAQSQYHKCKSVKTKVL